MMREASNFPPFCGGANDQIHEVMADEEMAGTSTDAVENMVQSPLDYVLQNLQIRLGNPRNRCFANAPFRLWSWAGSFLDGPKMWNRTTAAVMAALTDDEVVQITDLPPLTQLWKKFDDRVQDDAAQFLSELVALAEPQRVITHCYHVDHRQQVHHR